MNKDMLGCDAENLFSRREWYELGRLNATYDALLANHDYMVAQEVAYDVGYKKGYSDGSRQAMHVDVPVSFIEAIADDA